MTEPKTILAAAIQLEATTGDVAENLRRIEALVDDAGAGGAQLIAVPEFCSSRLPFDVHAHSAVLPTQSLALDLFKRLAARHQARIGASWLVAEGEEIFNRYHFVEPDGTVHCHDKDLPTMWENAFYGPGRGGDDGAFSTGIGGVGVAVCWELIRTQTVRRLMNRIDVAVTGTHWWSMPSNWGRLVSRALGAIGQYNRYLSENAPVEFARRLGVPVIQASHCGKFSSGFPLLPGLRYAAPYDTEYVGATQIVDAHGHVLAMRRTDEGPGVVFANIKIGAQAPSLALEDRFWIPELPLFLKAYWHHQNLCAKRYYKDKGRSLGVAAVAALRDE